MENSKNVKNGYLKISEKFSFMSLDRSRILFDRSDRNQESIESGRGFVMKFLNFPNDQEKDSTD